jgi:hypothetical protein
MNARFLNPPARNDNATMRPLDGTIPLHEALADRACCCTARAMVQVIMPPTPARPHRTELPLCGHRYRASREALAAAGATVHQLPGISDGTAAWIRLDRRGSPAQVS